VSFQIFNTLKKYIGIYTRRLTRGGGYNRFVILSFEDDGIYATRVSRNTSTKKISISTDILIPRVTERTLRHNKAMRTFLSLLFFPFSYRVCLIVPHHMGRSYNDTLRMVRSQPQTPITQEELDTFFAHQFGANVELYKKESMRRLGCEDVDVLLVESRIVAARVDSQSINLTAPEESIIGKKGKEILFSVVYTFMNRSSFSALHSVLPKRARMYTIVEEGFYVPIQIARDVWESDSSLLGISFITALVQRQGTDLFVCRKGTISYYDTIPAGYQSMYETINSRLGLNRESFDALIARMEDGNISSRLKKQLQEILSNEINRMVHGLQAVKRETAVRGIVCSPEGVRGYLQHDSRMRRTLIDIDSVAGDSTVMSLFPRQKSVLRVARVAYILETPRAHKLNTSAIRHIRWLLPHRIEKAREDD
jgi:hypothetical protein